MAAKPNGTFCWADLMPTDQARATAFYGAIAGWTAGTPHPEFGSYSMQFLGEESPANTVAGIAGAMEGVAVAWNLYFATDDFDATQAAALDGGATAAMPPFEIPGSGKGGFFVDPTGVLFGVWQSTGHDGFAHHGVPGTFAWAEAYTGAARRAAEFYAGVFGLEITPLSETDDFTYFQLKVPGQDDPVFGVMQTGDRTPDGGSGPHFTGYVAVADADASAALVAERGGTVVRGPFDSPFGRIVVITDTEGATLNLVDASRRSAD